MSLALQSGHWFRVAELRPRLRGHARVHRHVYRGEVWYVIHDNVSGEHHRFNAAAYEVIRQLDGSRTLQQIWEQLTASYRDGAPTQPEIVRVLGQLNAADLLVGAATPDVTELLDRGRKKRRRKLLGRFMNPMALRFPLWDPDALLGAAATWLRPVPAWLGVVLWGAVVLPALLLIPSHWTALTQNFGERLLAADNLWVLAVAFPLLKAAHELAHGLAVKRGGGEVHEMGIMLLVLYPVPYVDASAAHAFASKWRRAWVSAAGMGAEVWLAMFAFHAWLLLEPGLARSVAYNVLVLGSVTTVAFNANPLLRYDGYYILADLLEIPNLATRSTRYWQYLVTRYAFGIRDPAPFAASAGERRWFAVYAPLAFAYRIFVVLAIAWFVAQQYFLFGTLFALWALATGVLLPIGKALRALFTDPRYAARAGRVGATLGGALALLLGVLFVAPLPYHTRVEGVLWLPEQALLRAGADGFVQRVVAASGAQVEVGDAVAETLNPLLGARRAQQAARLDELQARLDAAWATRPAEAGRLDDQLRHEQAALERLDDEAAQLVARARSAGRLLIDRPQDLPGRFVHKGDLLGHVVGAQPPIVRIVVAQADAERVRLQAGDIEVRLADALAQPLPATLVRAVPKAAHELPSAALGPSGGGRQVVDPRDERLLTAVQTLFEFELALPAGYRARHLGQRAYVSIAHPPEAIGWRWLRSARRALLSKLEV